MCDHPRTIEDNAVGDEICAKCGLVISQIFGSSNEKNMSHREESKMNGHMLIFREFLLDICARLHLDNGVVVENTIHLLNVMKIDEKEAVKDKNRAKVAYALWEALNRIDIPKNPKEIAYICGVNPNQLLNVENEVDILSTYAPPSSFVEYGCARLGLPFFVQSMIYALVSRAEEDWYGKPELLVGAAILSVCDMIRSKYDHPPNFVDSVNIDEMTLMYFVTSKSLKNTMQKLPSYYIEKDHKHLKEDRFVLHFFRPRSMMQMN